MIRQDDPPKMYAVHLVKNGPLVPLKAWYGYPVDPVTGEPLDRSPRWHVLVGGEEVEPDTMLMRVGDVGYVKGTEIDQAEYDHLLAVREWARGTNAPEDRPREAINLNRLKPIF